MLSGVKIRHNCISSEKPFEGLECKLLSKSPSPLKRSGTDISAKLGMKRPQYWSIPKNDRTSEAFCGTGVFFIPQTLLRLGEIPGLEKI